MRKTFVVFGTHLGLFLSLVSLSCRSPSEKTQPTSIITQKTIETEDVLPLKVTHISPVGSVEGGLETCKILVGFNQPMTALQAVPREETEGPLEIEPPTSGKYRWLGTRTLAFIPSDTLPAATEFKVALKKEKVQSLTGMKLERDTSWTFESVRPNLLKSYPYHQSHFVDLKTNIYLYFNMEMAPERVGDKIQIFATRGMPSDVSCGSVKPSYPTQTKEEIPFRVRYLSDGEKKDWPLKNWENKRTLVLVPKKSFPIESQIDVYLYPGLLAKVGNIGLSQIRVITFRTYNLFALLNHSEKMAADDYLKLCFSNRVAVNEVIKNMEINPEVKIPQKYQEWKWSSNFIELNLPFEPNSEYKVRISGDLKDIFGNKLVRDYEFIIKVGDYKPHADIPTGINIVESKGSLRYPAKFVNVDSVYLEMTEIDPDSAVPFLKKLSFDPRSRYEPGSSDFFKVKRWWKADTYKKYRNKRIRLPIEIREVLGERRTGLVFVQFDNLGQNRWDPKRRYLKAFLEVGDLGLTWKYSPENNLVWVTSLNSTEPVENVRVQFRDKSNQILWKGLTDENGLCEFPGWAEFGLERGKRTYEYESEYQMCSWSYRYDPSLWIILSKEGSEVFSNRWNFGIEPWRFNVSYNWDIKPEEYGAYIFTEKGLYRTGETVHIKGILREKRKGQWILPETRRALLTVINSRDEEIASDTLNLNSFGALFKDLSLKEDAPTGVYSIRLSLPEKKYTFHPHYFRVEAYRPAEFEVKAFAERDTFIAGEIFKGKILGRYLFGMSMKDADVKWSLRSRYHHLRYPQYEKYTFGGYEPERREVLGTGTGKLNEKGELSVRLKLAPVDIKIPSAITLEGTVTAPNKRSISGRQNWIAFPSNLLLGLKTSEYLYTLGDTVKTALIAIRPSGEKVTGQGVSMKLFKVEWKSVKKARFGGRYEWVSERIEKEVKSEKATSSRDSTLVYFVPEAPGYYLIKAEAKDERGRETFTKVNFYVAGRGYAGWRMRDDDIIELVPDKETYEPGDTAKILVKSPYDSANAMVTVERELVLRKYITKLQGNADYVEIPINSADIPNIYVCVTLIRGRVPGLSWDEEKEEDLGKPQFKIGYANLKVDAKEKHLQVKTWPDRERYCPGDSMSVFYEVQNYKEEGAQNAEVALFAVDVGVLNLIDFRTPDPFVSFYGSRPLSVKTIESRLHLIGERSYGEKGEERGGGGGVEGILYREKFISTAFYKGDLRTDKQGRGKVTFVLPDNLTKFRIMAVAQTKNSEFGSAESTFVVNLPFILTPSLPRFARVGDEFEGGIVLHNRTNEEHKAKVECKAEGIKLVEENVKEIALAPNESKEVLFSFVAEKKGVAAFAFDAQMGKEKDALKIKIPVNLPPLVEAVATFSSTQDSSLEGIIVPSNIYENMGGLEIILSSSILAGMKRGIEHLLDYPYGCLEQRISRILPLIVGEELINTFHLAPVTGKALRDSVQSVLNEVPDYQLSDGGFIYFKGGNTPCPYLSAYTMYILKKAEDSGYLVDPGVIKTGISFLRKVLRWRDVDWTYPYNEYARLTTQAFCLYSLCLWGEGERPYVFNLFERREQIPIFGKTLLLKAGIILNIGDIFEEEISRIILNKAKVSPTTAHFEESENRGWTFPSPAKVTGFVLQTFTELDLPFPYKDQVMRWLVQERSKKSKPTTHENAFVFDAFQTYYKKYEKEEPDFVARFILDGKEILKQSFKGRTNEPPQKSLFSLESIQRDTLLPIKISKVGKGRLYYVLRMSYAFKENPAALDEGFYIWKEILTFDGKLVRRFKRGELYKVILHIVVPETRLFAVVEDPIPAGFEVVQTYFATESEEVKRKHREEMRQRKGHWWGSFDHEERYDDRVLLFAQHLFPGEHIWIYFVKATTGGRFLLPSTKSEEMYSPELFGVTPQKFMEIE